MPDPVTPNYGFTLPTVGADNGSWGGILNTDITDIDTEIKNRQNEAAAAQATADTALAASVNATVVAVTPAGSSSLYSVTLDLSQGTAFDIAAINESNSQPILLTLVFTNISSAVDSGKMAVIRAFCRMGFNVTGAVNVIVDTTSDGTATAALTLPVTAIQSTARRWLLTANADHASPVMGFDVLISRS